MTTHCVHIAPAQRPMTPPQVEKYCCRCDEQKIQRAQIKAPAGHGPYLQSRDYEVHWEPDPWIGTVCPKAAAG